MGLNFKKGRIPNSIKDYAKKMVDEHGDYWGYYYECYNCGFDEKYPDYARDCQAIDCIVKELRKRGLWNNDTQRNTKHD